MWKIKKVMFFFSFFFEKLPKFSDFVNFNDCIGLQCSETNEKSTFRFFDFQFSRYGHSKFLESSKKMRPKICALF